MCRVTLVFLALLLGTGVLPVSAYVPVNPNRQELSSSVQLVQQATKLYQTGEFAAATKLWKRAAQAFASQGDVLNQAMALSNLSLTHQQLSQWSEATLALTESIRLLQQGYNPNASKERLKILAATLDIQGRLQLAQGQATQALGTWEEATATYAKVGDRTGRTQSLINQAQALQALGLYRRAKDALQQVNQILQTQPNTLLKATGLRSLGNVLRVIGDLEESRQVLQQSLAVASSLQSAQAVSDAWLSLGNTVLAQQDTQAAINFYRQAATASASPTTRIQAQLNQLRLLLENKQVSTAQALVSQIQAQLPNLPTSQTAVYSRINFAKSLIRLKEIAADSAPSWLEIAQMLAATVQQAKSLGDQRAEAYALGNLGGLYEQTQQLSSAKSLTQEALSLAQAINIPDVSYRWQWQLGRLLKAQGDLKGATAAYTQAVTTLKSLRNDLVAVNPEVQFSFRDEVEPIYRQLVDLLLQSQGGTQNLVEARAVIESLQLAELDDFFRIACLEGKPVQIDSVVDKDDPQAAVIYPIILPDRLEVILKLPKQPLRSYKTTISQSEVESLLEELRQKLVKPYTLQETKRLSARIYGWLVKPAEAALAKSKVKTLVFVLDGSLRNIPMASLYDGQQYLVQKYAIALTPGLQLLAPKSLQKQKIKALTAGLTEARQGFSALTNVEFELEQIKSEVPSTMLLNQRFTSTALQKQINSVPVPVVHLATHGQFSSQADRTFILAWDKPILVNELNNLLQNRGTSSNEAIELLVLSACQTATGDKRAALGLAGVAMRAGARSTLASMWNLDDASTAILMSQFYQELANNRLNKAEALRQAQLKLLQNSKYQLPMFWAPFVLIGNWL